MYLLINRENARQMGENGRTYVARHFSIEEMVFQVHTLYSKVLGEKEAGSDK
ncbi:MAG: hypothetical protein KAV87_34895 [Desulfobacteraceae bacterium]|nr:hypothetical protein [Desulfobacteraceae bacterium]